MAYGVRGWLVTVGLILAGCGGDDGAADGSGSASGSADGSASGSAEGPSGGGCEVDADCYFGDCCTCAPISGPPPDCSQTGCPSAECTGLTATCEAGTCQAVLATCDPAAAQCVQEPPSCPGMLPFVVDGCWGPQCIFAENCDPECGGGPCPWRCPMGGDQLTVLSAADPDVVFENGADGKQFTCELTFDEDDDTYDCAAELVVGAVLVVASGGGNIGVCTQETPNLIGIPTGDPQQCTFQCTVTVPT